MRPSIKAIALLAVIAGCRHGPSESDLNAVVVGEGVYTEVKVGTQTLSGELLSIDRTGLVLRTKRIVFVPLPSIADARFPALGKRYWIRNGRAEVSAMETVRLATRFPYGISEQVMATLLASTNQTSIETIQ